MANADDLFPVTLVFPAGVKIAVPPTHEILDDGSIQATFQRHELQDALGALGLCVECRGLPPCAECFLRPRVTQPELFSAHARA